jgi:formamidopyrimidine-DNA glycosylase
VPELPEVETVANGVHARVRGQRIAGAWFSSKPEPMKTAPAVMERMLTGSRILRVHRVGKTVVFDLERGGKSKEDAGFSTASVRRRRTDSGRNDSSNFGRNDSSNFGRNDSSTFGRNDSSNFGRNERSTFDGNDNSFFQWLVHLGMTGQLLVAHPDMARPPHTHAVLSLAGGREVRFVDPRRFGRLSIYQGTGNGQQAVASKNHVLFTGSGAEPLTIGVNDFAELFRGRATPIKSALLNQKLLHGVGNIYADEALFRAGVRPTRRAARMTRAEMEKLRVGLVEVLRQAIKLGGSSVSDYVDADGAKGFFQLEHRVYQRTGQPCRVCGSPIRRKVIGGRSSHFCPQCQR